MGEKSRSDFSGRSQEHERPVEGAEHWTAAKNIEFHPLDLLEDAQAALDRGADLKADASRQRACERLTAQDHVARARYLEVHQRAPCGIAAAFGDVALAHAMARHLVLRDIDAALGEIELHVLPEVDQLQRRAHRVRGSEISFRRAFE